MKLLEPNLSTWKTRELEAEASAEGEGGLCCCLLMFPPEEPVGEKNSSSSSSSFSFSVTSLSLFCSSVVHGLNL